MPLQGTFLDNCIVDAMPSCLRWCYCASKTYLEMAELLLYKCYAKCREEAKDYENSFPISIGMFNLLKKNKVKYCL